MEVNAGALKVKNPGTLFPAAAQTSVSATGKMAAINTALAGGIEYTGPVGTHELTVTTSDLGNVGQQPADGVMTDTDKLAITVVPPTLPFAVADTPTVGEDSGTTELDVLANDFNFASQQGGAGLNIKAITQPPAGQGTVAIINGGTKLSYTTWRVMFTKSFLSADFSDVVVVYVTYKSNSQDKSRQIDRHWQTQTMDLLKNTVFLRNSRGEQVALAKFIAPQGAERSFQFIFPREINGKPFVAFEDKSLQLEFPIRSLAG